VNELEILLAERRRVRAEQEGFGLAIEFVGTSLDRTWLRL